MVSQKQIEELVNKYVGVPYCHAGRSMDGLDCLGLVYVFYRDIGIDVPDGDGTEYLPRWYEEDPERYLRGILAQGKAASVDDLRPLDFVYFRMGGVIAHAGVMIDTERFIHVLEGGSVRVSRLNSMWRRRLAGARRFVEWA